MNKFARKLTLFVIAVGIALGVSNVFQPSQALTNSGVITTLDTPLTEQFDSLAQAGTNIAWSDNVTIPGVYSTRATYNAGTGSSNAGALYSFGVAGAGPVGDRALGAVASGGTGTVYWGVRLTNNTGGTITSLAVQYTGEQWRNGGATSPAVSVAQSIDFQYQVAAGGVNAPTTGWLDHDALDFTSPTFGTTAAQTLDGNAAANRTAKSSTIAVSVANGQEIWLRWRDIDNTGNDHGMAIDDLEITASGVAGDSAPAVTTTIPANNATSVPVGSNIVVNFNENISTSAGAFAIDCGALQSFAFSASPASVTLDPDADLPYSASCTVTGTAALISDSDSNDPPDNPEENISFSFTTADPPPPGANVIINEIDADTPGSDTAEFVELFDGGAGSTPLDGLVVVFYTGPDANTPADEVDKSYAAFDLDGYVTDANGYFTLGNPGVPGVDLTFAPGEFGLLQNGPDAVAIYAGNAADFPFKTPVTVINLQDAIVYGTDDPNAVNLLPLLNAGQEQVNENAYGSGTLKSSQRCANGTGGARNTFTYQQALATPDGENNGCPPPPPAPGSSTIVISQLYGGGGNSGATYLNDYVELYNRGAAPVSVTGWSLQYASAAGSGWDFNKQPLAGTIAPGEYYLVSLASGTNGDGAPLPAANVTGGLINMSATAGKVALVDNFVALEGSCPKFDPHIKDLVGYGGTANCREGLAVAPGASNTTAILRKLDGATDTDQNGSDFATGAPNPRRTAPIVELGPYVLNTDPRSDDTSAPRDATIQVTFTEPVDVVDPWLTIVCAVTGVHDSYTQAGSGQNHYVTPNVNFEAGEQCTVTVFKDQVTDQDTDDPPGSDTMTADHSWTFTVATGTAPPFPASVHLTMGNPTSATADIGQPNNYLMEKPEFTLSYDRDLGRPNWVSWHLSSEWFGTLPRVDTFRADPAVPPDWYRVQSFDFSNSGFDRGHLVPNADRDKETSAPINQATFLMSNMVAQAPDNNQGPWAEFEGELRTLAGTENEIYIVAGGVGIGGVGSNGPDVIATVANGHVTVPERTWKVALVLPKDNGDDVSRVTCETRTIAIDMPNIQGIRTDPWENYLTTVDAVEDLTGYDLFSNLPLAIQACVEAGINGDNPPLDTAPPVINCASPDGAWHADNVELFCTASDGGSGLANAGDASFSLATSVADDSEDANASTGTRQVCDRAGNCATAGPIAGNKIDRKAPSITLTTPPDGAAYQVNRSVIAAFTCTETASGLASCDGTVANGAAIDTASIGPKVFSVSAVDAVGNATSVTVNYTVAANTIAINNLPAAPLVGDSFTPAFDYAGDGATSVTSNTPNRCVVSGGTVTFVRKGKCRLVAHATATANFSAATGAVQQVVIDKDHPDISIANIPADAVNGGSFVPVFDYDGDGATRVRSETPAVCRVRDGEVRFVAGGTCTLTPIATRSPGDYRVEGDPQSFNVGPAAATISIKNVPNKPKAGKSFVPRFDYEGDGATSVTSSTPAVCSVTGNTVNFLSAGTCTLTAHAAATASYLAATGSPESFLVK